MLSIQQAYLNNLTMPIKMECILYGYEWIVRMENVNLTEYGLRERKRFMIVVFETIENKQFSIFCLQFCNWISILCIGLDP